MNKWNFVPDHPLSLVLAADARLCQTDYLNDQIWEFRLGKADPPSISMESTFGLRARLCRIFPRFIYSDQAVSDPSEFAHPITIHRYYPNYINLSCKPFSSINVKLEYWVPDSHTLAGRVTIISTSRDDSTFQLEMTELLLPSADGTRMSVTEMGLNTLLAGKTADLSPILFLTGGAQVGKSPFPSLNLSYNIPAGGEIITRWAHVSLSDINSSFEHAKTVLVKNWDSEFAQIHRLNSRSMEIHTGNKDWDTSIHLSQIIAYQLLENPNRPGISQAFVSVRNPDQGYSLRKDGSDYNHLWNGLTPLDTYYLTQLILPASPELIKGILSNFIHTQISNGEVDLKPGLSGQLSRIQATPLLAYIALRLYEIDSDLDYLIEIFPHLFKFYRSWFSPSHDRDGDQIPEWDQTIQIGFDEIPLFSNNRKSSLGIDISSVESPALSALLYQECISLIKIATIVGNEETVRVLDADVDRLTSMVDLSWSDQFASYLNRDRDSHLFSDVELHLSFQGSGVFEIQRDFNQPIRPVIRLESKEEITHACVIFIHGNSPSGAHRVENIAPNQIRWWHQFGFVTSVYTYLSIERIELNGNKPDDLVQVSAVNHHHMDESLILPLWAGMPTKQRAKILINLTIMNKKKFLSPFGLRASVNSNTSDDAMDGFAGNNLPLTAMILDGLINYDARNKAAEIFTRLMKPITQSIQSGLVLYQSYHQETGKPLGSQNSLTSLIPINIFLKIVGIQIINPFHLVISGHNPFPWPITIKYRGLTVVKQEKKTMIIFPDGYSTTVTNDRKQIIARENFSKS